MKTLPSQISSPSALRPHLASELRVTLTRRMALAAFCIAALASGLHLGWTLYQRNELEDHLRDSLARSLQEPLRSHNLPAVQAILQAFSAASPGAEICVRLPGGDWLKEPRCGSAEFESYRLNLSKDEFSVSVTLPMLDRMVLFGVPFALAILVTLFLISQYLRQVSQRVLDDLERLSNSPEKSAVHYQELAQAADKIARGFQLQEENLRLAADARIGAIAGLAGHDIRAPLEILRIIASEAALHLSPQKRRVFESVTFQIEEVAEDLLEIGKLASTAGSGVALQWPPVGRQHATVQSVALASLAQMIIEEKCVQYQGRPDIQILLDIEPSADWLVVELAPRSLERTLSNLINNAVEALEGPGKVEVRLERRGDDAEIAIRDTGRGIPAEALGRIAQKRETFGKENGTGLGLFHAKETIESWGGTIRIESKVGVGTTIYVSIPVVQCAVNAELPEKPDLILIDNDPNVHALWHMGADEQGLALAALSSEAAFLARYFSLDRDTPIYLDKNGTEDGIEIAVRLAALGFHNLHLTTGDHIPTVPPGLKSVIGKKFPGVQAVPV